jgi:cardiolipin synthase A/B
MKLTVPKTIGLVTLGALLALLAANMFSRYEKKVTQPIAHLYGTTDPQFERTMGSLLGPAMLPGNKIDTLLNGDEIFPAMLEAIRSARHTITFETYIYWSGDVGRQFAEALSDRAKAGVKVHILLDWVGSQKMEEKYLQQMEGAGVEIQRYHPLSWYTLDRMNNRTHRKLLVVDGKVGFTGGVGIADDWSGHAQDSNHWRDTHYRVEGPVVAQMQAAFNDNWTKTSGAVLHGTHYYPVAQPAGETKAQMFMSSSEGGSESMHLMYLLAIASAEKTIDLAMAYFVPDDLALQALEAAMKRGVKVRIIMPGRHIDTGLVRRASRALWGRILDHGAEIYEFEPTMYHCKVLVIDGVWTSVGSTNFDNRSFRLNDEANLNVLDAAFAQRQLRDFDADLKRARRITLQEWESRPWKERLQERLASLLRSQL